MKTKFNSKTRSLVIDDNLHEACAKFQAFSVCFLPASICVGSVFWLSISSYHVVSEALVTLRYVKPDTCPVIAAPPSLTSSYHCPVAGETVLIDKSRDHLAQTQWRDVTRWSRRLSTELAGETLPMKILRYESKKPQQILMIVERAACVLI